MNKPSNRLSFFGNFGFKLLLIEVEKFKTSAVFYF